MAPVVPTDPNASPGPSPPPSAVDAIDRWFVDDVLPLEPALLRLLRRHWRRDADISDLRQEVYTRVYEGAGREGVPASTPAYVFRTARNLLIDCARRARVVSFTLVAELDELPDAPRNEWSPERETAARIELQMLADALGALPPKCREVVRLRRVEGLSQREIAARLGVAEGTVEKHMTLGMRALAEALAGRGVDAASDWLARVDGRVGAP
jgi:RNA polymerase sigma factor (sigma-70 family)